MKLVSVVAIATVGLLVGCGDLYQVRVHNPANPTGIPFFSNIGACLQETVYANPYYLLTLKVSGKAGVLVNDTLKVSKTGHQSSDFAALMAELEKQQPDFTSVQQAWNLLKQHQPFDPYTENDGQFVLRNTSKVTTIVDYAHPYSLNEHKPLAGSVSADYKLNSDGTLAEAQGQVQEQTLSTILGALPISDLIKSAAGVATKAGAAAAQQPEPVQFSLEQEERIVTKTYSLTSTYVADCPTGTAIAAGAANASTSIADIGAKDIGGTSNSGKADSSIGISGTITLPKALLPQPAKPGSNSGSPVSGAASPSGGSTSLSGSNGGPTKNTGSN